MVTAFVLATSAAQAASNVKKMNSAAQPVKAGVETIEYGPKKPSTSFFVLQVADATQAKK